MFPFLTLRFLSAGELYPDGGLPPHAGGQGAEEDLSGVRRLGLWVSLWGGVLRGLQGLLQEDHTG